MLEDVCAKQAYIQKKEPVRQNVNQNVDVRESSTTEWKEFDEQKNDEVTHESSTASTTESELPEKSTIEAENRL